MANILVKTAPNGTRFFENNTPGFFVEYVVCPAGSDPQHADSLITTNKEAAENAFSDMAWDIDDDPEQQEWVISGLTDPDEIDAFWNKE